MNPKALGSAWNEYFFSTLVAHADHDNTALKATKIDSILSRAILARVMEMNNAKRFTYLHSKAPIYKAQHMEEEGNASEENPQNLLPFKSSFNFPKKRTHSYQIKNVANVRHFHRPDPGNQYRSLTESIERWKAGPYFPLPHNHTVCPRIPASTMYIIETIVLASETRLTKHIISWMLCLRPASTNVKEKSAADAYCNWSWSYFRKSKVMQILITMPKLLFQKKNAITIKEI